MNASLRILCHCWHVYRELLSDGWVLNSLSSGQPFAVSGSGVASFPSLQNVLGAIIDGHKADVSGKFVFGKLCASGGKLLIAGSRPTALRLWSVQASVLPRFCIGNSNKKKVVDFYTILRTLLRGKYVAIRDKTAFKII
jgi:hypothetical protein